MGNCLVRGTIFSAHVRGIIKRLKEKETDMSHEELVDCYIKAWNELDATHLVPCLAPNFTYGSMWVFESLKGKQAYLEYITGKFNAIRRSGSSVLAVKGISPQTGLPRVELSQDGKRYAKIDIQSQDGLMTEAYMHDL